MEGIGPLVEGVRIGGKAFGLEQWDHIFRQVDVTGNDLLAELHLGEGLVLFARFEQAPGAGLVDEAADVEERLELRGIRCGIEQIELQAFPHIGGAEGIFFDDQVADVFRRNLTSGQEVGAAVAVYRDGVKVVDLWGGFRNGITKAPWAEDTLVPTFSTTKGLSALAVAVAASQGLISYDAKVADYWPEFAQAAKGTITVRQLLSHQAGLPVLDVPLTLPDLADPTKMSAALAAQAPAWNPGTRHGYHAITLGWYESELIRHADPSGRSLGQFFAEEIAKPLGLEFYI